MSRGNKAHTATANRIARRYNTAYNQNDGPDIECEDFTIEVETTATLDAAIRRLKKSDSVVYIAVTNKEALQEALHLTKDLAIGVMDPQGDIVKVLCS